MLYLIKDSRGSKTLVKIGVAKNLEQRMRSYYTHNPCAKLLQTAVPTVCTDKETEKLCQMYFTSHGYKRIKTTEWYEVPKKQKDYFFEDIEKAYENNPVGNLFESITKYKRTPLGNASELLLDF